MASLSLQHLRGQGGHVLLPLQAHGVDRELGSSKVMVAMPPSPFQGVVNGFMVDRV